MKELRLPTIVLSTKDEVLLPIEEAKYKLVFGKQRINYFECKIPKHLIERRFSAKQLCHSHCS